MTKIDLKRELDSYRARRGAFRLVDVPPAPYLMVDGHGDPNTSREYADALAVLYPVAYTLKFASKALGRDYVVMPLEALWWAADMDSFTVQRDKSAWEWTAMIRVPDWTSREAYDAALAEVARKDQAPVALDRVRLETLHEGLCVQTLHVGAYDDEGPVLAEMHHEFIPHNGLTMTGKHHEIYLSDPRRVPPANLRTILRQPVVAAGG